jgi:hypothetical protein
MKRILLLSSALALAACAVSKPEDFAPIPGGPQPPAPREAAHAMCLPQADIAGEQAAMLQQSMQGGVIAVGRPAFVAGAVVGHALGNAIAVGLARARAKEMHMAACMAQHGYAKVPKK